MLRELFQVFLPNCPPWARELGLEREHQAIAKRHARVPAAWSPHLAASRNAVLWAAERCPARGQALVIGAGDCLDVPVAELAERFARARAIGYDAIAVDCVRIADDASRDLIDDGKGGLMINSTSAARARLMVETRLKLLAKWDPKRYGERLQIEEQVNQKTLTREEALAQLANSGLSVADVFGVLAKPAEPVLEIEGAKTAKPAQAVSEPDIVDIDD